MFSWWFVFVVEKASLTDLFSEKNAYYAKRFFAGLFGIGEENPAFLNPDSWKTALGSNVRDTSNEYYGDWILNDCDVFNGYSCS